MNEQIQNIRKIIEQDGSLTPGQRKALEKAVAEAEKEFSIVSFKLERTEKVKRTTSILLEETIQELEQKRKAIEEKNRELEIESALEKVRTAAMAMKNRSDMISICRIIMEQLENLKVGGIRNVQTAIFEGTKGVYFNYEYYRNPEKEVVTTIPYDLHPVQNDFAIKMMRGAGEVYEHSFRGDEIKDWIKNQERTGEYIDPNLYNASILEYHWYSLGPVAMGISAYRQLDREEIALFIRFKNVFELAYRRYLDIEKAEAQAREAQIELALERVRARTMSMQKSDELQELITTVYAELTKLDVVLERCFIAIFDQETRASTWWMAAPEVPSGVRGLTMQYHESPPYLAYLEAWEKRQVKWEYVLEGITKTQWDDYIFIQTEFSQLPAQVIEFMKEKKLVYLNGAFNAFGCLSLATVVPLTDDQFDMMNRFSRVIDLGYTRFNDLKIAELRAKEAEIEASLERVRSRAMAMHSSKDLAETIAAFYQELELFSITPRRCGVGLLNKETRIAELSTMNTTEEGKSIEVIGQIKMSGHPVLEGVYDNWLRQEEYHPVLRGPEIKEYYKLVRPQIEFPDYPNDTVQYGYFFFFPEGGVYAWTEKELGEDELKLYRRFTSVLSLTYKRYKDLQQAEALALQAEQDLILLKEEKKRTEEALAELKETQKQLIHSEKMASLGELTAGIAHEIQNPLNFVNNFSEVSNELLDEMINELEHQNTKDAVAIAGDIRQNLQKILHHGKRADGIVKGMLLHSRSSSGQRESIDINALADEYLRLSYHGLRAKDKSFNAKFSTHFDEGISKVNVITQDMGRVILNLINNAFYAVSQRKKFNEKDYEPTVVLATAALGDKVEIRVKDNGTGIPGKVLDKIFQPFFTTKPTGEGTGLGLSLSYDIIRAHGGELKVETKEGEGSEFIIQLPVQ